MVETRFLITALVAVGLLGYVDHSKDPAALDAFGLVCCLMTLLFLGAPLGQIGTVVKLRDASVLLPSVATLAFANNVLWSAYGYLQKDPFMLVPNGIGTVLCAIQLALIGFYGRAAANLPTTSTHKTADAEENLQMTSISHGS
ncbi:sugar transmembrane transporter activity protein [Dipsacomyces acuminosporus]|nr:sugar transmembrane transporter activity protein [Dipsacomyces acuminosporus]